jgi:hypothetical protein
LPIWQSHAIDMDQLLCAGKSASPFNVASDGVEEGGGTVERRPEYSHKLNIPVAGSISVLFQSVSKSP